MAEGNRDSGRKFGRRRFWGRDRADQRGPDGRSDEDRKIPESKPREPPVECRMCGKPIFDLSSALADSEDGRPVHFDCALQRMNERESLGPREKLVYIGSGSFAVVEFRDQSESAFIVKRRVPFEKEGPPQEWRRGMSARIAELGIMGEPQPVAE